MGERGINQRGRQSIVSNCWRGKIKWTTSAYLRRPSIAAPVTLQRSGEITGNSEVLIGGEARKEVR